MKSIMLFLILFSVFYSCNSDRKASELVNNYIQENLKDIEGKIAKRGYRPADIEIKKSLELELLKIEGSYRKKNEENSIEFLLERLNAIEKYDERLDSSLFIFENITPYLIKSKGDSAVILFDLNPVGHYPAVFIADSDSAKKIDIASYNPIKINLKNPVWSIPNRPILIKPGTAGSYFFLSNESKEIYIKELVLCD